MTAALFFVGPDALDADRIVVDGAEGRHAADVRRLRVGEVVDIGDGRGRLAHGLVAEVGPGRIVVDVDSREEVGAPSPRFVVVQALAKGGRDLDAVEAMTEVGVDEVVGWQAARAVARWTERTAAKWQSTARAAAKQSRSPWVPVVSGPASTSQVAGRLRGAAVGVVLHESATRSLASLELPAAGEVVVVVGPEGGIADEELEDFRSAGAVECRLGDRVLRSSTAGVAALSVLSAKARWR
jgi:16S rRNA (uracil1498-N3)-methyltransferase